MNLVLFVFFFLSSSIMSCEFKDVISDPIIGAQDKKIYPGSYDMTSYLDNMKGKNIGIVVNHTSMIDDIHLVDTLLSLNITIKAIFSPEHGFKGTADAGEKITNDLYRGHIPIISLYGSKRKPLPADLNGIDLMVFDIQDVGVRFYTYISTLHYTMEAAADMGIPFVVFDRPNPNGFYVDGPIRLEKYQSFVGMHPVPVVHGMTIGEYALMINEEGWLQNGTRANLSVVKCLNYDHNSRYVLPVAPSPNLPNERAILLYPSLCLFEATTYSVGRGTTKQFQIYGHPEYPETNFSFTPQSSFGSKNPKHKDVSCYGEDLQKLSVEEIRSWKSLNLTYLLDAFSKSKDQSYTFFNDNNFFEKLCGVDNLRAQINNEIPLDEIKAGWQNDIEVFMKIRSRYLLYDDFKN